MYTNHRLPYNFRVNKPYLCIYIPCKLHKADRFSVIYITATNVNVTSRKDWWDYSTYIIMAVLKVETGIIASISASPVKYIETFKLTIL